jgi:DNA (cytosine-5)-methyltransferase 1
MIYGSVCSGIEAATVAWHPLGWRPAFFAEIEKFPSAVLAHHYGSNMPGEPLSRNGVPNHGDFTKITADAGPVDLLVGGTPCQSFSIAGKRLGLDDPRGNLALEYLALAQRLGARWIVWENVPGVLSSRSGDEAAETDEDGGGGLRKRRLRHVPRFRSAMRVWVRLPGS